MNPPEEAHALRKYRLIAEIGRGGMADVFLAVVQGPAGFNKLVVIKKTRSEMAHDPDFLAMFLDEARLAARLNHPNVVQTHEVGQDGERYFIAMEYLDGQPLNRIRARATTSFSTNMQVRVLADVLAGLHHAHELCDFDGTALDVVHRDATPQNVFVTYDGLIKVVDFGIAKAIDSSHETRAGMVKGKVTYMAPEQARGERVDRRADVFAVGVMLWEAISGKRMWKGIPELTVVHDLIGNQVPKIRDAMPDAPEALALICDRALASNRDDRYATAQDMHDALNEYLDGAGHTSARDVGKFVAEKFAEDRAKVKTLIESQLKDVRWSGSFPRVSAVDLPKIDPGQIVVTPTGQKPIDPGSSPSSPSGSLTNATSSVGPASQTAKPQRPVALMAVAAVAAIGVLVLGVRFLVPSNRPAPAPGPTQAAAAAAPPKETAPVPPPAPGQDTVKLTVHVEPADAKIYLDDALLSAGPFEGKVVKNDRARRVRAEAPHYVAKTETVTLTGDVMLSLSLEKEAGGAAPAPPGPAPRGGAHPGAGARAAARRRARAAPATARGRAGPRAGADQPSEAQASHRLRQPLRQSPMKNKSLAVAALTSLFSTTALAQPHPPAPAAAAAPAAPLTGPAAEADAHFRRGVQLFKETDYAAALIEFRRAYEIDPKFQALYNIGETYFELNDYANALKTLDKYLADGGARISPGRRDEVQKTVDLLRTRVATLDVMTNVPDVDVAIDDVPVGKTPLAAPLVVSAGRRKVTVTRPGKPPVTQIVELAGGDNRKIAVAVEVDQPAKDTSTKVPAAPWVVTGLLAAGAIGTGAAALDASSALKTDLTTVPGSANQISSDHSKTFGLALTTDVLIGAAVVVGVVSVVLTVRANGSRPADEKSAPPPAASARLLHPFSPAPEPGAAPYVRLGAGPQSVLLSGTF